MLNTPQDYEEEPPPALSNGASAEDSVTSDGDQKHRENPSGSEKLHPLHGTTADGLDLEPRTGSGCTTAGL